MSRLNILAVALALFAMPVAAGQASLLGAFATCTGRFSAEMEHAWLMGNDATYFEERRSQFSEMVGAVMHPDQGREALSLRIDAKFAHARLLNSATFADAPERRAIALRRAADELNTCTSMLLKS
jgi:hypothetical protein